MLLLVSYMQHFVRFLVDNWYILLEIFLLLLSVVFFILKKPTNKVVSGLFENLYNWCIDGIKQAEIHGDTSSHKLFLACQYVLQLIRANYPDLKAEKYEFIIQSLIENILSTPTKKGGCGREKEVIKKS